MLPARCCSCCSHHRAGTIAQDFSFEDAGNGFVYIRSHVSNLYVTVQAPDVITGGTTTTSAARGMGRGGGARGGTSDHDVRRSAWCHASRPDPPGPRIIQDRKYTPTRASSWAQRPALQKWKLSRVGITVLDRDLYVISNEAYPSLFLQPAVANQSGSAIVLGDARRIERGRSRATEHVERH